MMSLAQPAFATLSAVLGGVRRLKRAIRLPRSHVADDGLPGWRYVQPSDNFRFAAVRFAANPIIHSQMDGLAGEAGSNINGPSLIRTPDWIDRPLGRYYLYFAHHHGAYIRLAYADTLDGPWKVHPDGVLPMEQTPAYQGLERDHVASPDVHVDHQRRQIRMYYHADPRPGRPTWGQMSYIALSDDGLRFDCRTEPLGLFYFRVFRHADGRHYALAKYRRKGGIIYRSADGLSGFEAGPRILPRVRHTAVWMHEGRLYVFFSRGGDTPERILVTRVENLDDDWHHWRFAEPRTVLEPATDYEGVNAPLEPSDFGPRYGYVRQLRDPAIYEEDGRLFLLYSAAGESSIAIAELSLEQQ